MTFQQVLTAIDKTHHRAERHLSRMELDLLSGVLEERSRLVSVLVDGLEAWPVEGETKREALETIARQNARLVARMSARRDGAQSQLDDLVARACGIRAYGTHAN